MMNFSQSLKRSADLELCRASDIEKLARTSTSMEASLSTSQIKETVDVNMNVVEIEQLPEDVKSTEEKRTEVKEEAKKTQEPQKSVTPKTVTPSVGHNTVTVVAQIESESKLNAEVESEYETDTDESEVTVYNRKVEKKISDEATKESDENNTKKPSKTVTIDDEKNEEKVYRWDNIIGSVW